MRTTIGRRASGALAIITACLLTACGGGDGDSVSSASNPPSAAATLTLAADARTATWDAAATIDVTANDRVSSGTLSLVSVSVPAHGTTAIDNGKVVYTPAAGYYGPDSFSYTAKADAGGATASAVVSVTVEARIALTGTARDATLAGAAITADVGGRSFTATADASGNFRVMVRSASASDFIHIDAVGAGGIARLRTLVGEFGALVTAAAGRGRLDAARLARLDVTQHSTAMAALAIAAHGGTQPATAAQLDTALARVSADDALEMAALIQRVVDDGVPLPAGKADVWELVSDAAAYRSFLDATVAADPTAFKAAFRVASDSVPLAVPPTKGELAGHEIAWYGTGTGPDIAFLATFNGNGKLQLRGDFGTLIGTWSRSATEITIDYPEPLVATDWSVDNDPQTGVRNEVQDQQMRLVLRRHALAPTVWSATIIGTQTYLDGSRAGQTIAHETSTHMRHADLAARLPVAASEFGDGRRWAGFNREFRVSPAMLPRFSLFQDVMVMGPDGVAVSLADPTLTYTVGVADSTLSIACTSFGITYSETSYVRLAVEADGTERWLAMAPIVASPSLLGNGVVASIPVRPATGLSVDGAAMSRRWQASYSATGGSMVHHLFADFTGTTTGTVPGPKPFSRPTTWTLASDAVEVRVNAPGWSPHVRSWVPIARVGSSLWVLEKIRFEGDDRPSYDIAARLRRLDDLGPALK